MMGFKSNPKVKYDDKGRIIYHRTSFYERFYTYDDEGNIIKKEVNRLK